MSKGVLCAVCVLCVLAIGARAQSVSEKADALSDAARKGDAAAVKKLLDDGVDVNTKFRYDRTALSFAADRGHVEVVKVLLAHNADVTISGNGEVQLAASAKLDVRISGIGNVRYSGNPAITRSSSRS